MTYRVHAMQALNELFAIVVLLEIQIEMKLFVVLIIFIETQIHDYVHLLVCH